MIILFCFSSNPIFANIRYFQNGEKTTEYKLQPYDEVTYIITNASTEKVYPKIPILPNGHLTLPGLGEIDVFDKTVAQVEAEIKEKSGVESSLIVVTHQKHHVTVIGEVKKPGSYPVSELVSIYDAIGTAGGFTSLADKRNVKIIRQYRDGRREDYELNFPKQVFKAYEHGVGMDKYLAKENDIIYVPRSLLKTSGSILLKILNYATLGLVTAVIAVSLD